jgi:hypothetical protein
MADNHDLLKCPLCEGHGEISRAHLLELVEPQAIQRKIDSCLASACASDNKEPDLVGSAAGNPERRNFQEDVHGWNPQLPMWRRSPKE